MDWEELLDQRKYELEKPSPPEAGVPIPPPTIRPRRKAALEDHETDDLVQNTPPSWGPRSKTELVNGQTEAWERSPSDTSV
jgi:hypothetical protein